MERTDLMCLFFFLNVRGFFIACDSLFLCTSAIRWLQISEEEYNRKSVRYESASQVTFVRCGVLQCIWDRNGISGQRGQASPERSSYSLWWGLYDNMGLLAQIIRNYTAAFREVEGGCSFSSEESLPSLKTFSRRHGDQFFIGWGLASVPLLSEPACWGGERKHSRDGWGSLSSSLLLGWIVLQTCRIFLYAPRHYIVSFVAVAHRNNIKLTLTGLSLFGIFILLRVFIVDGGVVFRLQKKYFLQIETKDC